MAPVPGSSVWPIGAAAKRRDALGVARQIAGWEYVHIAIDDYTRLAYAEVLRDHKAPTVVAFLRRAVQFFAGTESRSSAC
jgi:hypothetical protein